MLQQSDGWEVAVREAHVAGADCQGAAGLDADEIVCAMRSKKSCGRRSGARLRRGRARRRWMRERGLFDPARLVFIDETAANTKMMRVGGRCVRGERLIGRVPNGHWKTITFVGALRCNGMTAPCVIDGAMKGKTFLDYVEQRLAPTLKRNDTVVMDNLPAHKAAGVREAIEARGAALRYLPQDSPDLNPIEMPFSKLKAYLRKAAERNIPGLRRRIRIFARNLTAREAKNYFRHAGYA